jgi:hypothetical protein
VPPYPDSKTPQKQNGDFSRKNSDGQSCGVEGSALISISFFLGLFALLFCLTFYHVLRNTGNHSSLVAMSGLSLPPDPLSEAKLERTAPESEPLSDLDLFMESLAEKSPAGQYFALARYEVVKHDKVELIAGLIVGVVLALLLGSGTWQSQLFVGVLAFFGTLVTIFLLQWIRAPSAFHKRTIAKLQKINLTDRGERRSVLIQRLTDLIKEYGQVNFGSASISTSKGLDKMLRFANHNGRVTQFLQAHYDLQTVKRFEQDGHGVLEELLAELLQPETAKIRGEIAEVYMESVIEIPDKVENRRFDSFITIKAHVFNARPNIPTSAKLQLEVETSKGRFPGRQIPLGDLRLKVNHKDTDQVPQMSKTVSALVNIEEQELAPVGSRLTLNPLNPKGEGWLRFIVPEEDAPSGEIQAITLLAIDDYGTPHRIPCAKSEWIQSGELVRQRDIDFEKELERIKDRRYSERFYGGK